MSSREASRTPPDVPAGVPRTLLAVFAAWLVPGLGHLLLGRVGRAVVFAALVFTSFGLGLAHDGKLAMRDSDQPFLSSLQLVANVGMGPWDLAARLAVYGEPAYVLRRSSGSPRMSDRLDVMQERNRSILSIYGTAYLWTAGLMNLLLLFDVWDLGRGRKD